MSITVINDFFDITILLVIRVINYLFNIIIVITRAIIAAQFIVEIDGQLPLYSSHTLREMMLMKRIAKRMEMVILMLFRSYLRHPKQSCLCIQVFHRYPSWRKNIFRLRKVFINFLIVTVEATSSCWVSIRSEVTWQIQESRPLTLGINIKQTKNKWHNGKNYWPLSEQYM